MSEHQNGLLVVLSGPSGVGKGTVCKKLNKHLLNMELSVSMTTRAPREGEVDGVNYHFVTEEQFQKAIDEDLFLENAPFVKNSYGTPLKPVVDWLAENKTVVLEIETNGARQVMEKRPDALTIFLLPPDMDELRKRITKRGTESEEEIDRRMAKAAGEMELKNLYQYNVINGDPDQCARDIEDIIQKERIRRGLVEAE